jgi:hypothetical protein
MPKINWSQVEDARDFEPLPIGKYPCVLAVDNKMRDSQGNMITDGNGRPAISTTRAGDERWSIKATILDGPHAGRWVLDSLSFGERALKRAKIVLKRAGIIDDDTTDYDPQPEELDGTYWWVDVDRHEPRQNADGSPKLRKDGKPIMDPRVAFAGYTPMDAKDAKRFRESYEAWKTRKETGASDDNLSAGSDDDEVPF